MFKNVNIHIILFSKYPLLKNANHFKISNLWLYNLKTKLETFCVQEIVFTNLGSRIKDSNRPSTLTTYTLPMRFYQH